MLGFLGLLVHVFVVHDKRGLVHNLVIPNELDRPIEHQDPAMLLGNHASHTHDLHGETQIQVDVSGDNDYIPPFLWPFESLDGGCTHILNMQQLR